MSDATVGRAAALAGGGLALAAIAVVVANTNVPAGESGGTREMIGTLIFLTVVATAIYFLILRRDQASATVAMVVAVIAVLSVVVFWSGLPFLLGATAVAVAQRSANRGRLPLLAQILGAVAVVAALAVLIFDKAS